MLPSISIDDSPHISCFSLNLQKILSVELGLFLRELKSGEMLAWREYCIDVTLAASSGI